MLYIRQLNSYDGLYGKTINISDEPVDEVHKVAWSTRWFTTAGYFKNTNIYVNSYRLHNLDIRFEPLG